MVESTGLENRHTLIAYLGFKSLSLRHILKKPLRNQRLFRYLETNMPHQFEIHLKDPKTTAQSIGGC